MTIATARLPAKQGWWPRFISRFSLSQLLTISWILMALKTWQLLSETISPTGLLVYSVWMALILSCAYLYLWNTPRRQLIQLQGWLQKIGWGPVAWVLASLVFFCDCLSLPASAQTGPSGSSAGFFFTNIQTKLTSIFAGSPQASIITPIVVFGFGILQVLFIVYIAFQIAKVVNAAREEEDWKQAAKTPIIVAVSLVGGDFAIGLV